MTIVIGLTGSIGTGKSTVTKLFEEFGAKTVNADTLVHEMLAKGGAAVGPVSAAFDGVLEDGAINRTKLGQKVFGNIELLRKLESIIHPLVVAAEEAFVARAKAQKARVVVMDIPLLFETGAEKRCDKVVVTTCPPDIQRERVLARPNMSEEKLVQILSRQMPDSEKQKRADFIVQTGHGLEYSRREVKTIMDSLNA